MPKWAKITFFVTVSLLSLGSTAHRTSNFPETPIVSIVPHSHPASVNVAEAAARALQRQNEKNRSSWYANATLTAFYAQVSRKPAPKPVKVRQSVPTSTLGGRIPYNYDLWIRVHNCEQPGTWHAGGYFGNGLAAGGNGLGFSRDAWQIAIRYAASRGVTLPASGWDATPDQQMQAAQAMLDATGGGPACL